MKKVCLLLIGMVAGMLIAPVSLTAQANLLQSGPMLGYSEMREVLIWVQTKEPAEVKARYWPKEGTGKFWTAPVNTIGMNAYTGKLIANQIEPGTAYEYEIYINDKLVKRPYPLEFQSRHLWQYRTDPPIMRMAVGSCSYFSEEKYDRPGRPYGDGYGIFEQIYAQNPDLMLWLGDNIYYRESDWSSRSGIMYRYTMARSREEIQPLLANTHHYAIWDDHDYGPNDGDHSYILKDHSLDAFRLFWGNPTYGNSELNGITSAFQWGGCDFFLLDNRWNRSQNDRVTGPRQILGETQINWLISALKGSKAPFKFVAVGGQVLCDAPVFENHIRIAPEEREMLLKAIQKEGITGVIFLTGDRHHSELSVLKAPNAPAIWDFTVSPLTSTAYDASDENNTLRVKGSHYGKRNFAMMEVTGPRLKRELKLFLYDTEGNEIWSHTIRETDFETNTDKK